MDRLDIWLNAQRGWRRLAVIGVSSYMPTVCLGFCVMGFWILGVSSSLPPMPVAGIVAIALLAIPAAVGLGSITAVAFDKTGTLTQGTPQLTDVETLDEGTVVEVEDLEEELDGGVLLELEALADGAGGVEHDADTQWEIGLLSELHDGRGRTAVIEQAEVFALEAGDEFALLVGDREDEIDFVDLNLDGLGGLVLIGKRRCGGLLTGSRNGGVCRGLSCRLSGCRRCLGG